MTKKYIGQSIKRNEDYRLLTGQALFVDDVQFPNMLHAAFLRSDYAHGRIQSIDISEAKKIEGVVAIYTAEDLGDYWKPGPLLVPPPPAQHVEFYERTQVPLAKDKVRHVGEPIAVVVAKSRYIAEDALSEIILDIDPLEVVADTLKALDENAPLVHEDLKNNLNSHVIQEKGNYEEAKAKADLVIKRDLYYDHGVAAAMENRGIVASWDQKTQKLTMWDTTQAPIPIRNGMAKMLGLSEMQVQVIAPFIGGAFGPKIMMFYPEEVLLPWISMKLKMPIKWIEDRQENFLSTTHEREQFHKAEIALSKDGKILGLKDFFYHDTGAYDPYGLTVAINSQCTLLGQYDIPNYYTEFKSVFTNRMYVTPYRGAGRQHGVFVVERLLDFAAKELGIDVVEIRKRNLIPKDAFPFNNKIIYQDFAPLVYDSGNFLPAVEKAAEMIEYEKFIKEEQPKLREEGKYVGIGLVTYVEGTGIGPYEGARVSVGIGDRISVATGVGTQGQGHFTSFAQVVAEVLKVDVSEIDIVTGDTGSFHWGTGTFASRGMVVAGNACYSAALSVKAKALKVASNHFDLPEEELELDAGYIKAKNDAEKKIKLSDLAALANPLRGAVTSGMEPGLEATEYFGPSSGTTASGVHAMIVEVDPQTMMLDIKKYVVVHDCGNMVNPMIVEGQIHGGLAQGIGNSFYEKVVYDSEGQLLTASFMDYLLPTATDIPTNIELAHVQTPSPLNKLGIKGVGEAGAIPPQPLFLQAIENALYDRKLEILEIPLSPNRLFEICQKAEGDS